MLTEVLRQALWCAETLLAVVTAYAVCSRIAPSRGLFERALGTGVIASATILLIVYTTALLHAFRPGFVAASGATLHLGLLILAVHPGGLPRLLMQLRADWGSCARVLRDVLDGADLLVLAAFASALIALTLSCLHVWYFPNWSFDVVWYHKPMTNYLVQTGSLDWVETNIPHLNSFAKHTELLAAWNVLLSGSTRLDDLPQIPLGLIGSVAVAALCRRSGAPLGLCAALGCVWLGLPSIALQLHTTHADVGSGAFLLVGFYFLTQPNFDRFSRWMTVLSLGLLAGTKGTGLFQLVLLAPCLAFRAARALSSERHRSRLSRIGEATGLVLALAYPGWVVYLRNLFAAGNPYWPLKLRVPLLGIELPGTITPEAMGNYPPAFFGFDWFGVKRMIGIWFTTKGEFYPDIREFPFGYVFPYLLLPCLIILLILIPWSRKSILKARLSFLALAVVSILVPAAWWGRFVLGLPAAGLCAYATVYQLARPPRLRWCLSGFLAFLIIGTWANMASGYRVMPFFGFSARVEERNSQKLRKAISWLWPHELSTLRERELQKGDLVAYDEQTSFLGEFWTEDVRNIVTYLPQAGQSVEEYLRKLRRLGVKWIALGANSPVEQQVRSQPADFQMIHRLPNQNVFLYRVVRR